MSLSRKEKLKINDSSRCIYVTWHTRTNETENDAHAMRYGSNYFCFCLMSRTAKSIRRWNDDDDHDDDVMIASSILKSPPLQRRNDADEWIRLPRHQKHQKSFRSIVVHKHTRDSCAFSVVSAPLFISRVEYYLCAAGLESFSSYWLVSLLFDYLTRHAFTVNSTVCTHSWDDQRVACVAVSTN